MSELWKASQGQTGGRHKAAQGFPALMLIVWHSLFNRWPVIFVDPTRRWIPLPSASVGRTETEGKRREPETYKWKNTSLDSGLIYKIWSSYSSVFFGLTILHFSSADAGMKV